MATIARTEDDVRTTPTRIRYVSPDSQINRRFVSAGVERNTGSYEDHDVLVRDGREIADHFTLDTHGFMLGRHRSGVTDFSDKDLVDRLYCREVAEFVKAQTGADHVFTQGWMIRTSADLSAKIQRVEGYEHKGGTQPPAGEAHVDYSPQTGPSVAERVYRTALPDGPGYSRFTAFSFWRTFSPPPQDIPLALCDGRSLRDDEGIQNVLHVVDAIPSEEVMRSPEAPGAMPVAASIFSYRPEHRWWYFSNMTADEILLFKFLDSRRDVTWRCPHSAFFDPSFADANTRASIEVRLVAYYD